MFKMFKKNYNYIIVLIVLAIVSLVYYFGNKPSTIGKEAEIALTDTSNVTAITLKVNNKEISFHKEKGIWLFNNGYFARPQALQMIISFIQGAEINSSLSHQKSNQAIPGIKQKSLQLLIYKQNKVLRDLYIQPDSVNPNLMLVWPQNSSKVYRVQVPALKSPFYQVMRCDTGFWRDRTIIACQPDEIKKVAVSYPSDELQSFYIENEQSSSFKIYDANHKQLTNISKDDLEMYLMGFHKVRVHAYLVNADNLVSQLKEITPGFIIEVAETNGRSIFIEGFTKYNNKSSVSGKAEEVDKNYLFLRMNHRDVALSRYVDIDPIAKTLADF